MDILRWRQAALAHLQIEHGAEALPDSAFHWARWLLLKGLSAYAVQQPLLAANAELGTMFQQLDLNLLAANACVDLVTVIGMGLKMPTDATPNDPMLNPRIWDENSLTSRIARTRPTGDGLDVSLQIASITPPALARARRTAVPDSAQAPVQITHGRHLVQRTGDQLDMRSPKMPASLAA